MTKLVPDAYVHVDTLAWLPWNEERKTPFMAEGASGEASVKVLARDPENGAETLLYRLSPGWRADSIRNTVQENTWVLEGELEIGGTALGRHVYSYRPEGHESGPVSTSTGATVLSMAGFPGELASGHGVEALDPASLDWVSFENSDTYAMKVLRADEQNLDLFYVMRVRAGNVTHGVTDHDAPEEVFIVEGRGETYEGSTGGRHINTPGTYVFRGPWSKHGENTVQEDHLVFKHDYFNPEHDTELFFSYFREETPAVKALREGRPVSLPKRW
jgi:hypothetical protein